VNGRCGTGARTCCTGGGWLDASGGGAELQADKNTIVTAEKRIGVTKEHALREMLCAMATY